MDSTLLPKVMACPWLGKNTVIDSKSMTQPIRMIQNHAHIYLANRMNSSKEQVGVRDENAAGRLHSMA